MKQATETVTVSPKFQVVIPKAIRSALKLKPGQRLQVLLYGNRIELVPIEPLAKLRGFARGIDTSVPRGGDRY